ncbi:hypothetical protein JCM10207_004044 [Rhodosporidiobolus poonsookiae]
MATAPRGTSTAHKPPKTRSKLPFAALAPATALPSDRFLDAVLVSVAPFQLQPGPRVTLTLSDTTKQRVQVQCRGAWAAECNDAARQRIGCRVVVSTKGGRCEAMPSSAVSGSRDVPLADRLRVVFEKGMEGVWYTKKGGKDGRFEFRDGPRTSTRTVLPSSSSPQSRFSSAASHASRASALDDKTNKHRTPSTSGGRVDKPLPPPTTLEKVAVPRANPANPYVGANRTSRYVDMPSPSPSNSTQNDPSTQPDPPSREPRSPVPAKVDKAATLQTKDGTTASTDDAKMLAEFAEFQVWKKAMEAGLGGTQKKRPAGGAEATADEGASESAAKKMKREKGTREKWGLKIDARLQYIALDSLPTKNMGEQNVIALAIVLDQPSEAQGGTRDWKINMLLYDPTTPQDGVKVHFFGHTEAMLPLPSDGDIVVLQRMHWKNDNRTFTAYANKGLFAVLPSATLLAPTPPILSSFTPHSRRAAALTDAELSYARDLAKWARRHDLLGNLVGGGKESKEELDAKARSAAVMKGSRGGRQTLRIEDMNADEFCDTTGEIVKFYNSFSIDRYKTPHANEFCNLFITDYTSHPELVDYSGDSGIKVNGQRVLQVSIFGAQNEPLLSIPEDKLVGRLVRLRNIRPKMAGGGFLEATMVEDFKYPDRRDVTLVKESNVAKDWLKAFKQRREAFWGGEAEQNDGEAAHADPLREISDLSSHPSTQQFSGALSLNQPGTYRLRLRIADFSPPNLQDWAVAFCPRCDRDLGPSEEKCIDCGVVDYEWLFRLLLVGEGEEAEEGVLVTVSGDEADALLPSFPATSFAALRAGDPSPLHARLRGVLGPTLESKKRHRQALDPAEDAGPAWDAVMEAVKGEGEGEGGGRVWWRFAEGKVVFR